MGARASLYRFPDDAKRLQTNLQSACDRGIANDKCEVMKELLHRCLISRWFETSGEEEEVGESRLARNPNTNTHNFRARSMRYVGLGTKAQSYFCLDLFLLSFVAFGFTTSFLGLVKTSLLQYVSFCILTVSRHFEHFETTRLANA